MNHSVLQPNINENSWKNLDPRIFQKLNKLRDTILKIARNAVRCNEDKLVIRNFTKKRKLTKTIIISVTCVELCLLERI